jgi:outer membrane protein assembly factor BamB
MNNMSSAFASNRIPNRSFGPKCLRWHRGLVLGSLFGIGIMLQAGDWRQFRGPHGNGVADETGVPAVLNDENIAWKTDLPGRGLSSPIIVGERLFVTASSGAKQERLHVICFDAGTGEKRWERQFWATGVTLTHEKTSVAAPTPASDGQRVFASFSSNDLVCLDLDGNLQWLRGLTHDYPRASNSLGMSSSLLVVGDVVISMVENDAESFTVGIDIQSGANRWKLDRPKMANWTSPYLIEAEGGTWVALQSGKGISAVEPQTGRVAWEYTDGASTIPSGTVSGGIVFAPSHGLTAILPGVDGQPPVQLWRSGQLRPATASPVVNRGRTYTLNDGGVLTCGDATDGTRLWQLRLKGPHSATPVAAGDLL